MDPHAIFSSTLGLVAPWQITKVDVSRDLSRLDIYVGYKHPPSVPCPSCGKATEVCGEGTMLWHHSDFFNKEAFLHVVVPVLKCGTPCSCIKAKVQWSDSGSRFVLQDETLSPDCSSCEYGKTYGIINSYSLILG